MGKPFISRALNANSENTFSNPGEIDSVSSESPVAYDISTPDISVLADSYTNLSNEGCAVSEGYVSFVMTILILSSFIVWEIISGSNVDHMGDNPISILRSLKEKNADRPVISHLNINFIAPKFEVFKSFIKDNVDLLMISETKIDDTFPTEQFKIEGYFQTYKI